MIDALGNAELKGKVVQIVPAADSASRSFLVKIDLPADPRLRSGLFGRAQFSRGERQALLIPRSAVVERGQLQGVYVLDQNKVASSALRHLGKAFRGRGRSAGRPAGRRAARGQTGCSRPEWQTH